MAEDIQKMIVVPVDGSENAFKSLDYINRDLNRFIPDSLVDEFPEFQKFWQRKAGKEIAPYMQKARDMLLAAGIKNVQCTTRVADGSRSAATDILEEAQRIDAGTIFLGLHGYSNVKEYTMGNVARKVLNHAADMAVCIVP